MQIYKIFYQVFLGIGEETIRIVRDLFSLFSVSNIIILFLLILVVAVVIYYSEPVLSSSISWDLLTHSAWDPNRNSYGVLFAVGGSVVVAVIAILIAGALSISSALFVVEIAPRKLRSTLETLIDLGAVTPSVVYGLWGLYYLAPLLRDYFMKPLIGSFPVLRSILGYYSPSGVSILTAGVLLGIMIYPFTTSLMREAIKLIPMSIKEALYSLGLTKWEVLLHEIRYIRSSIIASLLIGYGRAVGETVAVALVIGNIVNPFFYMIFEPGYTVSSLIANQFLNATGEMIPVLYFSALTLLVIGFALNIIVMIIMKRRS